MSITYIKYCVKCGKKFFTCDNGVTVCDKCNVN